MSGQKANGVTQFTYRFRKVSSTAVDLLQSCQRSVMHYCIPLRTILAIQERSEQGNQTSHYVRLVICQLKLSDAMGQYDLDGRCRTWHRITQPFQICPPFDRCSRKVGYRRRNSEERKQTSRVVNAVRQRTDGVDRSQETCSGVHQPLGPR